MSKLTFLSTCYVPAPMLGALHMLSHLVLTEILKVDGISHILQMRKVRLRKKIKKYNPVYTASKWQSRDLSTVPLSSCVTPSCLSVR